MPKVLLTHSYFLKLDPKEYRAMMPYAPLGTLYAAAFIRQHGYDVALFDAMIADSEHEIADAINAESPDVVVVYDDDFNYLTKMCLERMRHAAFTMTRIAKEKGCKVLIHGSDAADHASKYIDHGADAVIIGEGEQTLLETLDQLCGKTETPLESIPGVEFRVEGKQVRSPKRSVLKTLDQLPLPARDLLDVDRYRSLWKSHHGYFSMNLVTTRGCPFHCNWCAKPIYGQVYNSRSPQQVVEEMLDVKKRFAPDHFWFCDDIFGLKPGWVPEFSHEVIRQNAITPFKCLSRADLLLNEDAIRHLAAAGCQTIWIGAESGSQRILDAMDKGTTVGQIREASRKLHEAGIRVGFFLQYGYPGETLEDIQATLDMVHECMPDEIGISVSYPLPGTKFFESVRASLGQQQNWHDSEDLALMFTGTYHPDFYRTLHKITHKKFRMWQGLGYARTSLSHPGTLSFSRLRRIASVGYHALTLPKYESRLRALQSYSHAPTAGGTG